MAGRRPLVLCLEWSRHKAALERHGYDVIAVTNGRDAFEVLSENPVDAIILDLETPETNNHAVVRRMKEIKPYIPVLLLVSPLAKISSGRFPAADSVVPRNDAPVRLVQALEHLLDVRFPFFTRWFGNWKHRAGA